MQVCAPQRLWAQIIFSILHIFIFFFVKTVKQKLRSVTVAERKCLTCNKNQSCFSYKRSRDSDDMYSNVCLCVYKGVCVCACASVYVCVCVSVCASASVCLCVCVWMCACVCKCVCLCVRFGMSEISGSKHTVFAVTIATGVWAYLKGRLSRSCLIKSEPSGSARPSVCSIFCSSRCDVPIRRPIKHLNANAGRRWRYPIGWHRHKHIGAAGLLNRFQALKKKIRSFIQHLLGYQTNEFWEVCAQLKLEKVFSANTAR